MPLYNVELTLKCVIVVQADDEDHAWDASSAHWKEAISDSDATPVVHVTGDVTQERHLRGGWDAECVPYGGDGNTRISALLRHNTERSGP